jgi:YLP motif-containing protein 1
VQPPPPLATGPVAGASLPSPQQPLPQLATAAAAGGSSEAAAQLKQSLEALRTLVDITTLLRRPGRMSRPPRIFIVLRGLPGSGKSHLARKIREVT